MFGNVAAVGLDAALRNGVVLPNPGAVLFFMGSKELLAPMVGIHQDSGRKQKFNIRLREKVRELVRQFGFARVRALYEERNVDGCGVMAGLRLTFIMHSDPRAILPEATKLEVLDRVTTGVREALFGERDDELDNASAAGVLNIAHTSNLERFVAELLATLWNGAREQLRTLVGPVAISRKRVIEHAA